MKEIEAEQLIQAYIDPHKKKTAELLAQKLNGNPEEINVFLDSVHSTNPKIKEIAALFLKHSLSLSLRTAPRADMYKIIFTRIYNEISEVSSRTDNLIYESIGILSTAISIDDVFLTLNIESTFSPELMCPNRTTVKALAVLNKYTEKYRTQEKSNDLYVEIIQLIEKTKYAFSGFVKYILVNPTNDLCPLVYTNLYSILSNIFVHDLPDYFEENIRDYTLGLYAKVESVNVSLTRSIIILRIKLSSVLVSRYSDAYDDFSVFTDNLTELYSRTELLDEGVQLEFMNYLQVLLGNYAILNSAVPLNSQTILQNTIVQMLLSKIEFDDSIEGLEYMQSLLEGDPTLLRDISSSILKDLVERDFSIFFALSQHKAHDNVLFLILYLMKNKYRTNTSAQIYEEWIKYSIHSILGRPGPIKVGICCAILIVSLHLNIYSSEIILNSSGIFQVIIENIGTTPESILYLYLELAYTLSIYNKESISVSVPVDTLKHLISILKKSPNECIGRGLFYLMKLSKTRETLYFSGIAYDLLVNHIDTVGNTKLAKSLWDIVSLDVTQSKTSLDIPAKLIIHSINNNLYEYYTYAIQLLSIINTVYSIEYYISVSMDIINNQTLWEDKHLLPSLTYLMVSVRKCNSVSLSTVFKYIISDDISLKIISRYLDNTNILAIYNSAKDIPQLLVRYIKVLQHTEYTDELYSVAAKFTSKPVVLEEDTESSIQILEEYTRKHNHCAEQIHNIIDRLKRRRYKKKDDPWTLSTVDETFIRQ